MLSHDTRWQCDLHVQHPIGTGLPLYQILIMPACCILFRYTLFCPGQGDSVRMAVGKCEETGPHLVGKSIAFATWLPSLLFLQRATGRYIDAYIIAIEG